MLYFKYFCAITKYYTYIFIKVNMLCIIYLNVYIEIIYLDIFNIF